MLWSEGCLGPIIKNGDDSGLPGRGPHQRLTALVIPIFDFDSFRNHFQKIEIFGNPVNELHMFRLRRVKSLNSRTH